MTEEIPDGFGVANYTTSMLQQFRKQPIKPETMVVRRVVIGGVEGREASFEIEAASDTFVRETIWVTAVGPRAYLFMLVVKPEEQEKYEPYFKRMMLSARIGAAGHWNEEFENLRARFAATLIAGRDVEVASLSEALRAGREPTAVLTNRLAELAAKAPDAVLDLLADSDPQVRAAAITAFGQSHGQVTGQDKEAWEAGVTDILLWSLMDKEVYCSATAAQRLAARGPAALAALKGKLSVLADAPGAIVRAGAALTDEAARELARELLQSESSKQQLAGLDLALALPLKGLQLPYAKLFASSDLKVLSTIAEAIQVRRATEAVPELLKLLRGDAERWVVKALGEVAPIEVERQFNARIAELDARLGVIVVKSNQGNQGAKKNQKKSQPPLGLPGGMVLSTAMMMPVATLEEWKKKPEAERLAWLRGELVGAADKIKFRDRWQRASDETARRAILDEINHDHSDLILWSQAVLQRVSSPPTSPTIDSARFKDAPTTGETLFPSNTTLYLMSPNFDGTLAKLDAALSGVQMGTVRDQMVFALIFKTLKAQLAATLKTEAVGEVGAALGIDLKAPLAMAAWPSEGRAGGSVEGNAVVLRVTDRARFERLLAFYQQEYGSADSFVTTASSLTRFIGMMPAVVPLALTMTSSAEARGLPSSWLPRSKPGSTHISTPGTIYFRQERLGELPITVIEKLSSFLDVAERQAIYVAYLGTTAIVAPTREALSDLLKPRERQSSLAQSETFTRARAEAGEIVFFSQLGPLFKKAFAKADDDSFFNTFINVLGAETGALHLTPTSWETVFHLGLAENDLLKSLKPFKASELAAPRELLPPSTILYAGAMIDPPKLLSFIKGMDESIKQNEKKDPKKKEPSQKSENDAKAASSSSAVSDAEIEQLIVPHLQGEIAAALISLKPVLTDSGKDYPAMVLAFKLKNRELAEMLRAGKLFANKKRVPDATALGAPVVAMGDEDDNSVAVVTDDYLIFAESIETLRLLEAKEKFASTRDFTRSSSAVPGNLALFATYNLDASFDEAQNVLTKSESTQQLLPVLSAMIHAFHSQRALLALDGNDGKALEGRLAVAFDREGRYGIGELTAQASEFDVANALITPKGLNIFHAPRVESLKLRVMAKQPGVAPRLRDDVIKFAWQRIESSDASTVAFSTSARRIPDNFTVKLPVASTPELAPYLRSNARILSTAPQVVALAKQIAGDDRDGRSVAHKLGEWTHNNLKWKKVESDAVETLASREADCLEHSELYVSLARALGLPARVVTGAAYGGGSFGAHAWVEIYLGQWVEVDPTWGMMDYVDATHLRFDGDAFVSYAMLNQLEMEIIAARNSIADYQRDPLQLVKVLAASESEDKVGRELMFDLALITEQALGAGQWAKLNEQQRTSVISAFDRLVAEQLKTWGPEWGSNVRVLTSEVKEGRATVLLLRGTDLMRLTLAARDGAWYLTEIEDLDNQIPIFSQVLRGALQPSANRWQLFSLTPERALKKLDQLIATEGESASLLLIKAQVLSRKHQIEEFNRIVEQPAAEKSAEKAAENTEPKAQAAPSGPPPRDEARELFQQIITRWPDFAPAYYALAAEISPESDDQAAWEKKIAALQRYTQLVPIDPRPWQGLASAFEARKQFSEAEAAYLEVLKRDRESLSPQINLVAFYLRQSQPVKAKASLASAFKMASDVDDVFAELDTTVVEEDPEDLSEEQLRQYETLLLGFPKELARSKAGLRALAAAQQAQKKTKEALATMQRTLTLKPEASDYFYVAKLNRELRRFTAALTAADQSLKLNDKYFGAHVERACALAQLGRQQEALAALKQAVTQAPYMRDSLKEEEDLKPLANLPEFKALLETPDKPPKSK
jgi:tetratricopeptide (TPR) repeat protein